MEIEKIKLTDIVPADYNPRHISNEEKKKLENSIDNFGIVEPILINLSNNRIIGGHQRYEVLINEHMLNGEFYAELNLIRMGDIGWIFTETDLHIEDEDHEKALNLALNKISGEWDADKLGDLLDELSQNNFNIELTGFEDFEVQELNFLNDIEFDADLDLNDEDLSEDKEEPKTEVTCPYCNETFEV